MKIEIPNGIGTLILSGCGNSNMINRTQEDLDSGKSSKCGVDRICDYCMGYVFNNIYRIYLKEYRKTSKARDVSP